MFAIIYLKKLKKYHYAFKDKTKLILDRRLFDRNEVWNRIKPYIKNKIDEYNIGFWSYTNDMVSYTDMFMSKHDFDTYVEKIIELAFR